MIDHDGLVALARMARGVAAAEEVAAASPAVAARTFFTIARDERWGVLLAKTDAPERVYTAFRNLVSLYRVDWDAMPREGTLEEALAAIAKQASSKHRSKLVAYDLGDDGVGIMVIVSASASVFVRGGARAGLRSWIVGVKA